jgi:hypothetical protein
VDGKIFAINMELDTPQEVMLDLDTKINPLNQKFLGILKPGSTDVSINKMTSAQCLIL